MGLNKEHRFQALLKMLTKFQEAEKMCFLNNAGTVQHSSVSYITFILVTLSRPRIILLLSKAIRFVLNGFSISAAFNYRQNLKQ